VTAEPERILAVNAELMLCHLMLHDSVPLAKADAQLLVPAVVGRQTGWLQQQAAFLTIAFID